MGKEERLVYSVYDLVELLGLSISSAYQAITNNEIPHIRVGSRILIPKKMLDEWLSKRQTKTSGVLLNNKKTTR